LYNASDVSSHKQRAIYNYIRDLIFPYYVAHLIGQIYTGSVLHSICTEFIYRFYREKSRKRQQTDASSIYRIWDTRRIEGFIAKKTVHFLKLTTVLTKELFGQIYYAKHR